MHFLPRRHIECYLINAEAIAAFIAERDSQDSTVGPDQITATLIELAGNDNFKVAEWTGDLADPVWLAKVDAANLIAEVCASLSEHRVTLNKKDDTLNLLQRVQAANDSQISELAEYVRTLVDAVNALR